MKEYGLSRNEIPMIEEYIEVLLDQGYLYRDQFQQLHPGVVSEGQEVTKAQTPWLTPNLEAINCIFGLNWNSASSKNIWAQRDLNSRHPGISEIKPVRV